MGTRELRLSNIHRSVSFIAPISSSRVLHMDRRMLGSFARVDGGTRICAMLIHDACAGRSLKCDVLDTSNQWDRQRGTLGTHPALASYPSGVCMECVSQDKPTKLLVLAAAAKVGKPHKGVESRDARAQQR